MISYMAVPPSGVGEGAGVPCTLGFGFAKLYISIGRLPKWYIQSTDRSLVSSMLKNPRVRKYVLESRTTDAMFFACTDPLLTSAEYEAPVCVSKYPPLIAAIVLNRCENAVIPSLPAGLKYGLITAPFFFKSTSIYQQLRTGEVLVPLNSLTPSGKLYSLDISVHDIACEKAIPVVSKAKRKVFIQFTKQ